jgi:hypothetical protein
MRVVCLGAAALLAASLASGPVLASDNCPRLQSSSLVILVPEGGCAADATAILDETKGVTVIRGAGYPKAARTASADVPQRARVRIYPPGIRSPSVIFINIDQSRR